MKGAAEHLLNRGEEWLVSGAAAVAASYFAVHGWLAGEPGSWSEVALSECRVGMGLDVIVVAGGRGERLGGVKPGDKANMALGQFALLDYALAVTAVATKTIVVGSERPTWRSVTWSQEDPPGSGPGAGLFAGIEHVTADRVAIVGVDMPDIAPGIDALATALDKNADAVAALVVDGEGQTEPLASMWHRSALQAALVDRPADGQWALRSLFADRNVVMVPDPHGYATDIDTDAEREAMLARWRLGPVHQPLAEINLGNGA